MKTMGEERLESRRAWLRSLSEQDRNFIAKYGEEAWRKKKVLEQARPEARELAPIEQPIQESIPEETIHLGLRESMEVNLYESEQNYLKNLDAMNRELKELQMQFIKNLDERDDELTEAQLDFIENLNKRNKEVVEKTLETYEHLNKNMTAQSEVIQKYSNRAIELLEIEHKLTIEHHEAFMAYIALKTKHEKEKDTN